MQTAHIMSHDGNLVIIHNDQQYSIGSDHPNYDDILFALANQDFDNLESMMDIPKAVAAIDGDLEVDNFGNVTFAGQRIHNTVTERITQFMNMGLPFGGLINFLRNLLDNPSGRSLKELYGFLEHKGLPITEDGCFIAYKGIRNDWKDKYSGTIDNSIGQTPRFTRNMVDDNCNNTCSNGLHVGTFEYASTWAGGDGRVVLVKVNPAHAVSVPTDHDASKLRVCEYEVIAEAPQQPLQEPCYVASIAMDNDDDDEYDDDWDNQPEW